MKAYYRYLQSLIACCVLLTVVSCVSMRDKGVLRTHAEFDKERRAVSNDRGRYPRWDYQGTNQEGLDVFAVPVQLSVTGPQKFDVYKVVKEVSPVKEADRFYIKENDIRGSLMDFDPKRTYFREYR